MRRVAIRDVAEDAGVSRATVSNYFNRPGLLSEATRQRIDASVERLGYVRSEAARQLRAGDSRAIALVVFEIANSFVADLASSIERGAAANGLHLVLGNSDGASERELDYLRLFEQQRVGGLIVAPLGDIDQELEAMRGRGTPVVITGRRSRSPSIASVSVDDAEGGRMAAQRLIDIGKRSIAFVGGPVSLPQISDRFHGALAAARASRVRIEIIETDLRTIESGQEVAARLRELDPEHRPDGIVAVNDMVAIGLVQGLTTDGGLRVPDDIAIVGYDDIGFAQSAVVPLTTVRTPGREQGSTAVELLMEQMSDSRGEPRQVVFRPQLVVRASA